MLRSTGFFRGIDCPFYCENNNGKAGADGCSRPYCHFRHSKQRRAASGIYDIKKTKALSASPDGELKCLCGLSFFFCSDSILVHVHLNGQKLSAVEQRNKTTTAFNCGSVLTYVRQSNLCINSKYFL